MQSVDLQQHEMSVAFMRGSSHGWIYMETTMMPAFQHLLLQILGVIGSRRGLIKFPIDTLDHIGTIMLPKLIEDYFEVGHWVCVLQGPYKSDISLVDSVQTWGISLLLVPRMLPAWVDRNLTANRKQKQHQHTPRPPPALFNAFQFISELNSLSADCYGRTSIITQSLHISYLFPPP